MHRSTHCTIMCCDVMGQQHPPNQWFFTFAKFPTLLRASFRRAPFFLGGQELGRMAFWHNAQYITMVPHFSVVCSLDPLSIHYRYTKSYFGLVDIGNTADSLYGLFVYHEFSCGLTRFCPHFAKDTSFFGRSQCRVMI